MTDEELNGLFSALREESAVAHEVTRNDFRKTAEESRRHFEVLTERRDKRFDFLAEAVQTIDEKVDRRVGAVEAAIVNSAAETQAMIKFSHEELQRRVRAL